ncbi:hypothetical protein ILUMI_02930 [Ignelater luminosus]|uniref:Uncharacterized protein n=1 Tax=Ignelater luminosus TaxID=2038154 RepID=A0A8K0GKE6_IGNLU|nr:hypothetical protein ILUMI_02930 [Ignelater luminosus]
MENADNLIQTSTRKRKLSSFLRDDEEYYIPKSFRKLKPTTVPHPSTSFKRTDPQTPEAGTSLESLRKENESLIALCAELNDANKKLQQENSELQGKIKMQPVKTLTGNEANENDNDANWGKYPTGTLSVEMLADLWNEVCTIPIPSCSCSTKVNAVAKKRVTQRITPLITL